MMRKLNVLVTGAGGLVGTALLKRLAQDNGINTVAALRQTSARCVADRYLFGDVAQLDARALAGVDVLVHAAARVHIMHDTAPDPLAAFRQQNTALTLNLAREAVKAGVRRFIYLSTLKVHGEATPNNVPFTAKSAFCSDFAAAVDPYALSKIEAERGLAAHADDMEICVVRPPLIYGAGVKANFLSLMRAVARGVPLPVKSIRNNRRSLLALDNFCDLLHRTLTHPQAAQRGEVRAFLVSDGESLSTAELVERLARALHRPCRSWPCPPLILRWGAAVLGRQAAADRLCSSLLADISDTCRCLDWQPPLSVDEGLALAVDSLSIASPAGC